MAKQVKVSVILTSYNHAKYLRESIESVLHQTYSNFELLIVDDGSTDESWEIISSYADPRIQTFRSNTNTGHGGDIRRAISEISTGEYIAIHHSDDVWEPQKLEKQVAFLNENPNIGAVFTNVTVIGENSELLEDNTHPYQIAFEQPNRSRYEWLNYFFSIGNALCHPSVLIRRACYEDCGLYRYGLAQLADFDLWVRLCLKYDINILPEKLLRLRVRSNAMNASADRPDSRIRMRFEFLKILDNFRNVLTFEELLLIFPPAEKYARPEGFDAGFILGMISLESEMVYDNIRYLFGLTLLFEALNDPERAAKIAGLYDFKLQDFVVLSGKFDIFSIELLASQAAQLAEQEHQLAEQEQWILALVEEKHDLSQSLLEIRNSRAWRLVTAYRDTKARVLTALKLRIK